MLKAANMGTCHYHQSPGSGRGKWAVIVLLPINPNFQHLTSLKYVQKNVATVSTTIAKDLQLF